MPYLQSLHKIASVLEPNLVSTFLTLVKSQCTKFTSFTLVNLKYPHIGQDYKITICLQDETGLSQH